jgi:NTE family protein
MKWWFGKRVRRLNLALQGGGAHGAFTWGVLDQLLLEESLSMAWISGTSAGALNAVAVAHGLATGGRQAAREALEAVWSDVESAGVPDLLSLNPLLAGFTRSANLNGLFSPYNFNPLGFDPLRKILEKHIDFDAIRAHRECRVMVAATDVATGKARLFSGDALTIEAVLASACLPTLHHAVIIGGRAYWDGGFSANPDLLSLALESPINDTLMVLLNPLSAPDVPKSAREIEDRVNTITFNQPLLRDIDTIVRAKGMQPGWFAPRRTALARLKRHRFHLIEAGRHTAGLDAETKVIPDRAVLKQLYMAGLLEAERWMGRHARSVGRRGTVSLHDHFNATGEGMATPVVGTGGPSALAKSA